MDLEQCRIYTNYRKLPYGVGYGLRLGVNAATRLGLKKANIPNLADILTDIIRNGVSEINKEKARRFIKKLWDES
jgi:glycine hydroxymethyltransferase